MGSALRVQLHQFGVKAQIVDSGEPKPQRITNRQQMPQISSRVIAAGKTIARLAHRPGVPPVDIIKGIKITIKIFIGVGTKIGIDIGIDIGVEVGIGVG